MQVRAYAVASAAAPLAPTRIDRREPGPRDVVIDVLYCGVCHSDIHTARGEWGGTSYPAVPGHEIVGRVSAVGRAVKRFKTGEPVGVGCLVDSCRQCANCKAGLEQHCQGGPTFTYNSPDKKGSGHTFGGYADTIVVDQDFVLRIPSKMPLERTAPLLCAGITTYSPLKRFGAKRGKTVGVLGLGGLGHMAVKLAAAMGAKVVVFSGSESKRADAKRLGATGFVRTSDATAAAAATSMIDLLIDTVSGPHDISAALGWLSTGGVAVMVGASPDPLSLGVFPLIMGRRALAGSLIGGISETQDMLDFCARKGVYSDVEVLPVAKVNEAYERVLKGDVRYRFVLDLKTP